MSHIARLKAISACLRTLPGFRKSSVPDAECAERHVSPKGMPIVVEPRGEHYNRIWVRADSLDLPPISDIEHKLFIKPSTQKQRPNHDLYTDPLFMNADLICLHAKTFADAKRIIDAVVIAGATP